LPAAVPPQPIASAANIGSNRVFHLVSAKVTDSDAT
jgi:hypothetical protein